MTSPPSPLSSSPRSHPPQTSRRLHPAYVAGEIEVEESKRELAVQEAYTPDSQCFGCGPAAPDGLGHGNWTAAVALMDRSCLPRPPLTLTAELLVNFREPTPPGVPLIVRSTVARVRESASAGSGKASVQVDLTLHALGGGAEGAGAGTGGAEGASDSRIGSGGSKETLLATATGIFKKLGALRAL